MGITIRSLFFLIAFASASLAQAQAPTLSAPTAISTTEDLRFEFSGAFLVSVADADSPTLVIDVQASPGCVEMPVTTQVAFEIGSGGCQPRKRFSGTLARLNDALGSLRLRGPVDYHGAGIVSVAAEDGGFPSASHAIAVSWAPEVDAFDDSFVTDEDVELYASVLSNDRFEGTRTITAVGAPGNGTLTIDGTAVRYRPNVDFNGADRFTYTVTAGGVQETATVDVSVTPVSEAPQVNLPPQPVFYTEDTSLPISGIQIVDDSPTILVALRAVRGTLTASPFGGTAPTWDGSRMFVDGPVAEVNGVLASLVFHPLANDNTFVPIDIYLEDDRVRTPLPRWLLLTGVPVNDPPVVGPQSTFAFVEDQFPASLYFNGTDLDGSTGQDEVIVARLEIDHGWLLLPSSPADAFIVGSPNQPTRIIEVRVGRETVFPALSNVNLLLERDYHGPLVIHYRLRDQAGASDETVLHATVSPRRDIVDDAATVREDGSVSFNVLTDAPGRDGFSDPARAMMSAGGAQHGNVSWLENGGVTYVPDADFSGSDVFDYTVSAGGSTETGTVSVTVRPVNDAPTFAPITAPALLRDNAGAQTLDVDGIAAGGGETQSLALTVTSSDETVIAPPQVEYESPDAQGLIGFAPLRAGVATLTIELADGGGTFDGGVDRVQQQIEIVVGDSAPPVFANGFE